MKEVHFFNQTIKNTNNRIFRKYSMNDDLVGYVYYNLLNGKIDLLYITEPYRNKTLGKQILFNTINEMKQHDIKEIWCCATKEHLFWKNVNNKSFTYRNPINDIEKYPGYYLKIDNKNKN